MWNTIERAPNIEIATAQKARLAMTRDEEGGCHRERSAASSGSMLGGGKALTEIATLRSQ